MTITTSVKLYEILSNYHPANDPYNGVPVRMLLVGHALATGSGHACIIKSPCIHAYVSHLSHACMIRILDHLQLVYAPSSSTAQLNTLRTKWTACNTSTCMIGRRTNWGKHVYVKDFRWFPLYNMPVVSKGPRTHEAIDVD